MFPRRATAAALVALFATIAAQAAEPAVPLESLRLEMNDVTVLETESDIRTIMVASPDIADASVATPRKLLLLGKKPGITTVLVIDAAGNRLRSLSVMVAPSEKGVVTVDRGIKETNLTCSPRCVASESAKDTSGGATPAPAAPLPSAPAPMAAPANAPANAPAGGLSLLPPPVQTNP